MLTKVLRFKELLEHVVAFVEKMIKKFAQHFLSFNHLPDSSLSSGNMMCYVLTQQKSQKVYCWGG